MKTGIFNREQELEKAKALIGEKEIQIEILRKNRNMKELGLLTRYKGVAKRKRNRAGSRSPALINIFK